MKFHAIEVRVNMKFPGNIHHFLTEGQWKFQVGVFLDPVKKGAKFDFPEGSGVLTKQPSVEVMDIFWNHKMTFRGGDGASMQLNLRRGSLSNSYLSGTSAHDLCNTGAGPVSTHLFSVYWELMIL